MRHGAVQLTDKTAQDLIEARLEVAFRQDIYPSPYLDMRTLLYEQQEAAFQQYFGLVAFAK